MTITTTQREAALRLIDELSRPHCDLGQQEAAALLRELLAEPHYTITWDAQGRRLVNGELAPEHRTAKPAQQPQDEPVAWCCLTPSGKIAYSDGKPMVMPGPVGNEVHRTPLYAHPQQRKSLSAEQIDKILDRVRMNWASSPPTHEFALAFARAVERAHGIGGKE